MSVLVKGMKMPACCDECEFKLWSSNLHQTVRCAKNHNAPCFEDYSGEFLKKRAEFCPFVEVPAPHGDLLDIESKITVGIKDRLKCTTVRGLLNGTTVRLPKPVIEAEGTE